MGQYSSFLACLVCKYKTYVMFVLFIIINILIKLLMWINHLFCSHISLHFLIHEYISELFEFPFFFFKEPDAKHDSWITVSTLFMDIHGATTMQQKQNLIYKDVTFEKCFLLIFIIHAPLSNPVQQNSGQDRV